MPQPILPQVKNIVFLMLENRSLDNLLGWLYRGSAPRNVYPAGSSPQYDGLQQGKFTNPYWTFWGTIEDYPVVPVPDNLGSNQGLVPYWDPTEEMYTRWSWNGVLNQLFGDVRLVGGIPSTGTPARMLGFYQDYYRGHMTNWQGMDILWTFTPKQLPIINGLALGFAVSDAWFCSVPTQTNPNRAYSIIGTSQGRNNNTWNAVEQFEAPTVFNGLARAGKSWGLYYTDTWQEGKSYTEYTFPNMSSAGGKIAKIEQFFTDAKNGTLPDFTYLEPKWGYGITWPFVQGTDYHPPTNVYPGESFLAQVFQALRQSRQWDQMLFVVTFDEHGGTYDHVPPPWGAINPDGIIGEYGFGFNVFGARVPTLLISPFVRTSTVFRAPAGSRYPFDHTSFIKTFLLWAGVDLNTVNYGKRMPAAPTFEGVLSTHHVNDGIADLEPMPEAPPPPPEPIPGLDAEPPMPAREPLNALFEGVSFASVRRIVRDHQSLAAIRQEIERYRADPEKFETELVET